jgi:hypothetical protein
MAEQLAGFGRAWAAGGWLSSSPRVQRLAAIQIAVLLGLASVTVAVHKHPAARGEPLALAAATGPAAAPVVVDDRHVARPARVTPARARPARQPKREKRPTDPGWAYWSVRIRGCESHGRPDAPADYKAKNPHSTASGAYQITDATWGGRYGISHASDASPVQQDTAAADLYRRHGTADWAASAPCWRVR